MTDAYTDSQKKILHKSEIVDKNACGFLLFYLLL